MKVETAVFAFLAVFFFIITLIYGFWSREPAGTACLALTFGLALLISSYLGVTARRMEARPEDRGDADISEGAGEIGFFAPHSWWPIALAGGFAITTMGFVFGPFLIAIGAAILVFATMGFLFEFYVGINRTQGQTLGALEAIGERPTSVHKFLGD